MERPYIPTDAERGAAYRAQLGLASIEQARTVDHPFQGSFIRGECFVCEQTQPSPRHGPIHFMDSGSFACDPGARAGVNAPMFQRTRRREFASCPGCVVVLAAAEILARAAEVETGLGRDQEPE
jgi:hypothetical protein